MLAKHLGHKVFVSDFGKIKKRYKKELTTNDIDFESEKHTESKILKATQIVLSPGIPVKAPIVQKALQASIPVISEIEFGARHTSATLIGITGTNGKTTTTLLTHHLLQKAGFKVGLAGNVGYSFARQVIDPTITHYVLELSSFQLDLMFETKLDYAVLLNITPDHLDRYDNYEAYIASKFRITQNQDASCRFIYCSDSEPVSEYVSSHTFHAQCIPFSYEKEKQSMAWVERQTMHISLNQPKIKFTMNLNQLTIGGKHNTYNSMAASIIANSL